ncbi:MAG: ribosome maturation factor RimM [Candidatus Eremiobacteraeota bacterium]|nr:ribosome maturation factor RimM [Candidatus Eremiobacteraeota bacterium]
MNGELEVGRIAGLFGLRGELKCDPSSAGFSLFSVGARLRCERANLSREVTLVEVREHKGRLLIRFDGCESANEAQPYVGASLFANTGEVTLEANEYLDRDLVGCRLVDPAGITLGTVTGVAHYPTADMLVVGSGLVPMIHQFIKGIDIGEKQITVELPIGLLDLNQAHEA